MTPSKIKFSKQLRISLISETINYFFKRQKVISMSKSKKGPKINPLSFNNYVSKCSPKALYTDRPSKIDNMALSIKLLVLKKKLPISYNYTNTSFVSAKIKIQ